MEQKEVTNRKKWQLIQINIHAMLSNPLYADQLPDTIIRLAKEMAEKTIEAEKNENN